MTAINSIEEIVAKVAQRRLAAGPLIAAMLRVRDRVNADVVTPLPNSADETPNRPNMPAVISNAINNLAVRAGSMTPVIYCPAVDPAKLTGRRSIEYARTRRRALGYTWFKSDWELAAYRLYRHLAGYSTAAIDVQADLNFGYPCVKVRDPLSCVDTETEILTKRGWLRHNELREGDEVAGYDLDLGMARWTQCFGINRYEHDGDLVAVDRRSLSMRLTTNHRCVVQKRIARDVNRPGPVHTVLAGELNSTHYIPKSADWVDHGEKSIGADLAALCGWVAAEGWYTRPRGRGIRTHASHAVYMSQSPTANPQHVRTIDALIGRLDAYYGDGGRRWDREHGGHRDIEWKLSPALSNEVRRLMPDKLLGLWCLDLPETERQALLDAFTDGDGHRRDAAAVVVQKLRWNLDVLQIVATTLGYKTSLRRHGPDKWALDLNKGRTPVSLRARTARATPGLMPREHYKGIVWCPTTGTGTWFARRDGFVFITGNSFPEPKAPEDLSPPIDCAFIYSKSRDWLLKTYPECATIVGRSGLGGTSGDTQMWELVEWIDEQSIVIGLLGPQVAYRSQFTEPLRHVMELRRWPNRAGRCTTYIPRQVTMDRIANQIANMVGSVDLMAKLVELDVRATERSIYPDRYIIGKLGQSPQLVGGKWADGASGEVNIIIDAESVGQLHGTPDPHNTQTIDRLERAFNVTAGVVPQMGGETYGALRTGRGIDSLLGASVDPRIQEMHVIMQKAMLHANETIAEVWKGYWPTKKVTGFSGWATDRGQVSFTPQEHFETVDNAVLYPIPGADVQTATVILGQVYGMKAMSLDTLRHLHPYVSDPEGEGTQRLVEDIEEALKASLLQRAMSGEIPDVDMAEILDMVMAGMSLQKAVIEQHKVAQARQAAQAPAPGAGQVAAPEAMPGLANPGMGAEQSAAGTVPPPPVGLDNFRMLASALRRPQQGVGVPLGSQGGG